MFHALDLGDASFTYSISSFLSITSSTVNSFSFQRARRYFYHALLLRCPYCGITPIFPSLKKTRSLRDWFAPLDGCHRCGYPYEREPGYFLLATWAGSYGMGSLLGLSLYFFFDLNYHPPIFYLLLIVLGPIVLFNLLFARHAKALFIAFDHFFDPHEKEANDNDDDRGHRKTPKPVAPVTPNAKRSFAFQEK